MFKLMVFWDVVDWYQHLEEPHSCNFHAEGGCNSFLQSDGTCLPHCIVLHDLNTYKTLEAEITALFSLVDIQWMYYALLAATWAKWKW